MPKGNGVVFNNIGQQIGKTNVTNFRTNGRFICERSGIYLVSVSIMANDNGNDAEFFIRKNNQTIAHVDIGEHSGYNWWYSGTAVVAEHLEVNDSIWVDIDGNFNVYGGTCCFLSLVKVK